MSFYYTYLLCLQGKITQFYHQKYPYFQSDGIIFVTFSTFYCFQKYEFGDKFR
jgi:hypothetical protein